MRMKIAYAAMFATAVSAPSYAATPAIELTQGDAEALQAIMRKDKLLQAMASDKGPEQLKILGRIVSMVIKGPLKLEMQWDQALLEGWRKANAATVKIGALAICKDIALASAAADNVQDSQFFDQLSLARGC